jgi:zinc/manganese transport system permease protein
MTSLDWQLILYPFLAGLLVLSTHVPLGRTVLKKGIIFIDLAIAQVAALGVVVAHLFEWAHEGEMNLVTQAAAAGAACAAALLLTWSGRRWPHLQEALIGMLFVLAACAGILLLAHNPHGGEHLKDLLAGQILWVGGAQLVAPALLYMPLFGLLLLGRHRLGDAGFYLVFALAITVSVQLVGVFLVFSSLIAPAVASHRYSGTRGRIVGYGVGALGYALGLAVSARFDLPAGPAIAACLCLLSIGGLPGSTAVKR